MSLVLCDGWSFFWVGNIGTRGVCGAVLGHF